MESNCHAVSASERKMLIMQYPMLTYFTWDSHEQVLSKKLPIVLGDIWVGRMEYGAAIQSSCGTVYMPVGASACTG